MTSKSFYQFKRMNVESFLTEQERIVLIYYAKEIFFRFELILVPKVFLCELSFLLKLCVSQGASQTFHYAI